jgi:signal transduction histidine kinase
MWRIIFLHVVAVAITATLLRFVLYWSLDADVEKLQQEAMQAQAELIARYLEPAASGGWSLHLPPGLRDQYSEAYGRYTYVIQDDSGSVLFSSRAAPQPLFSTEHQSSPVAFFETPTPGGEQTVSGASLRKEIDGRGIWVQVAEDLSNRDVIIDDVLINFFQQVGWIIIPVLLLLLVVDIAIFRRAMKPLLHASDQAKHISPTRIDVRLPTDKIPVEILPLVVAVNQALDRLEQGFRSQREFTADAAHELRTPLAILRTRVGLLTQKDQAQALDRDIESMSRVVGQLLDAAELETIVIDPDDRADLQDICAEVVGFLAPLALAKGKTIELSGAKGPVPIRGNPEMVRRAIRNLVENALHHTPVGTVVEVAVNEAGAVSVLDEGEGIPDAERELIFRRFWRRDRRRIGGAGLGLSIVKRVVEAHGGTIAVENRPEGGAIFTIRFTPAEAEKRALAERQDRSAAPAV